MSEKLTIEKMQLAVASYKMRNGEDPLVILISSIDEYRRLIGDAGGIAAHRYAFNGIGVVGCSFVGPGNVYCAGPPITDAEVRRAHEGKDPGSIRDYWRQRFEKLESQIAAIMGPEGAITKVCSEIVGLKEQARLARITASDLVNGDTSWQRVVDTRLKRIEAARDKADSGLAALEKQFTVLQERLAALDKRVSSVDAQPGEGDAMRTKKLDYVTREVEAAIRRMPREWGYCVGENDPTHCPECGLVWALEALTAERERAARAERERKEMEMRVIACGVAATHPDAELTARPPYADRWGSQQLLYVCELRAERDTLRQHNAVLRAECQAGRKMADAYDEWVSWPSPAHEHSHRYAIREHDDARAATDAAGAMGDTEVGR